MAGDPPVRILVIDRRGNTHSAFYDQLLDVLIVDSSENISFQRFEPPKLTVVSAAKAEAYRKWRNARPAYNRYLQLLHQGRYLGVQKPIQYVRRLPRSDRKQKRKMRVQKLRECKLF